MKKAIKKIIEMLEEYKRSNPEVPLTIDGVIALIKTEDKSETIINSK